MNGNSHTPTMRPGLLARLVRDGPAEGQWKNTYCRCCGATIGRLDRYLFSVAAGLCLHLGQPVNRECREHYLRQQERLVGPRQILIETLYVDQGWIFGLDCAGHRRRLGPRLSRDEAVRCVFAQLRLLHRFEARQDQDEC